MLRVFFALIIIFVTSISYAQILQKNQIVMEGKTYTVVLYSNKCFVAAGEGARVVLYDAGGNPVMNICRTGGGPEPAIWTFEDGSQHRAPF